MTAQQPRFYQIHAVITNGVELTPENVGKLVKMTCTLREVKTGRLHRTNECEGKYVGAQVQEFEEVYQVFEDGFINDNYQTYFGMLASDFV